jgi:phosphatidylinositol alpha-1,6-mannosyltransferase
MPGSGSAPGEVLFVTSSYPRWHGDESTPFMHHLAQDLRALGWDVHVLAPHAPGAARREVLDGVPVERFRYFWPESLETVCYDGGALPKLRANRWLLLRVPFLVAAQWLVLLRRLLGGHVALVHSHWLLPQGLTAGLAAAICRRPHVATVHGSDVFALQGGLSRACKWIAIRLADAVTVNSTATRAAVTSLSTVAGELALIPMGATVPGPSIEIDAATLRASLRRGNGPLLAFVGRLIPEKGVDDLLHAVQLLARELPDLTAIVVGDGPERASLERLAARLGIDDRVQFTGWLSSPEVQKRLRAADVFIGPSRPGVDGTTEAQGLVFAEAMLAGLPVVATAFGGIVDAIRDGETGLTVPPGSPEAIAAAVRRLAGDAGLARRLAGRGRVLAMAGFTREASAHRFATLYTRLLAGRLQQPSREKT